jgi:hypothetical protein
MNAPVGKPCDADEFPASMDLEAPVLDQRALDLLFAFHRIRDPALQERR